MKETIVGADGRAGTVLSWLTYPIRLGPLAPAAPDGRPVLERTPFSQLAAVHACSSAGDALVTVALAGSVFASVSLHAARGRTAVGLLCTVVPFVVVAPVLGPVIDRARGGRRFMVFLSAVGRAGACLLMARWIHSLLLFPAAFLSLVCSKTYLVAKASLVPNVVLRTDQLVEANSKLAVGSSIVTSAAAAVGALIYKGVSSTAVLYLDVVVLSVCAYLAIRMPTAAARPPSLPCKEGAPSLSRWRGQPGLPPGGLALTALVMASMRAMAGLMIALVIFGFRRDSAPLIWYGLVGVASVGGNLGGAALAPLVRQRVHEERIVIAGAVAVGVVAIAVTQMGGMHRRPAALVLGIAVGLCASVAKLAFDALVQRDAPSGSRSRLFARLEAVFQLVWVLAALIPVIIPMSLLVGYLLVAVATLGATVVFVVGMRRARRGTLPLWWPGAASCLPPRPVGLGGSPGPVGDIGGSRDAHGGANLPPPPSGPLPP